MLLEIRAEGYIPPLTATDNWGALPVKGFVVVHKIHFKKGLFWIWSLPYNQRLRTYWRVGEFVLLKQTHNSPQLIKNGWL